MSSPGRMVGVRDRITRFLFTGSSGARLGATRAVLGFGLLPFHILQYHNLLQVDAGGPQWFYLDRVWYFDLLGIRYHEPVAVMVAFALLLVATLCFALGYKTRLAAWTSLILILFLKGARDSIAGDVHHREIIPFHILLFFALSRCGDTFSLDERRKGARPLAEWEASWPIQASQLYVAAFYFWSGVAKLRVSGFNWIESGAGLDQKLVSRSLRFGSPEDGELSGSPLALWLAQYPDLLQMLALSTLAMELSFLALPFVRSFRIRAVFLTSVTFFHIANFVLLNVKFLFLPVVFVIFFNFAIDGQAIRSWRNRKTGFGGQPPSDMPQVDAPGSG